MNAITPPATTGRSGSFEIVRTCDHAHEIMAAATMADLVKLNSLFQAAINARPGYNEETAERMDDEMGVLAAFDHELTARLIDREPKSAEEYRIKAAYLFERLRHHDSISDANRSQALTALEREARTMADLSEGLPLQAVG